MLWLVFDTGVWARSNRGLIVADYAADPASVSNLFYEAATGGGEWGDALAALAALTGSYTGELLGFGRTNALAFYCRNAIAPELIDDFRNARGYDPTVNSRVRLGLQISPFEIRDERDFTTALDAERNPEYGEYIRKIDGPYICLGNLLREQGMTVGLSVIRTAAQGNISANQRRAFADVMPHVRSAVRTHLLLEDRQIASVAETFDRVSAAAFVCTSNGILQALSPAAETLLREGDWLSVRDATLVSYASSDTRLLHAALHNAAAAGASMAAPPPRPFTIRNAAGDLLPLEAVPYVARGSLRSDDLAILLAKPPRDMGQRVSTIAQAVFQLTGREAVIATDLVRGRTVADIATSSGSAVGTVRVHLRNIFEKVGVHNQGQLISKLCSYL